MGHRCVGGAGGGCLPLSHLHGPVLCCLQPSGGGPGPIAKPVFTAPGAPVRCKLCGGVPPPSPQMHSGMRGHYEMAWRRGSRTSWPSETRLDPWQTTSASPFAWTTACESAARSPGVQALMSLFLQQSPQRSQCSWGGPILTLDERQCQLRDWACLYCGQPEHVIWVCPVWPKGTGSSVRLGGLRIHNSSPRCGAKGFHI